MPIGKYLPAFADSESWQQFLTTTVAARLPSASPAVRQKIALLEKEAVEPEAQRISTFSSGGSPAGIASFTNKLFCHNFTADPGTVPIITTYLMHPVLGGCSSTSQINAYMPLFKRRVDAIVQTTGARRVVYLLELDAVGSSSCMAQHHSLGAWEHMLRYEVDQMATLKHAVVYIEGGYSDSNTPRYAARVLNASDIKKVRGFWTNDTHINWTSHEIKYGDAISRMTHGSHFIVSPERGGPPERSCSPRTQTASPVPASPAGPTDRHGVPCGQTPTSAEAGGG